MTRLLNRLIECRGAPVPKQVWEKQYQEGYWDYLNSLEELPRYSLIASYFEWLKSGGSILEIGCGEGLLQQRLLHYSKYVGIDLSEAAIVKARSRATANSQFLSANAATYTAFELFDAIVFNEVLYYFERPLEVFDRYSSCLTHNGIFITSLYTNNKEADTIYKKLKRKPFAILAEIKITNGNDTWVVSVFQKSERLTS